MNRVLEWGLRGWAMVQGLVAAVWVLVGPVGPIRLGSSALPHWVHELLDPTLLAGLFTGPIIGANLTDSATLAQFTNLAGTVNITPAGPVSGAYGDINPGWSVQFSILTTPQGWAWVALHVIPFVVMGVLWWLLADVVAQSRQEQVFTRANAHRLNAAGIVLLVGAPLASVLRWAFYVSVADSSQIAERISIPSYSIAQLPWAAMALGLTLMVLGRIWIRGVSMETELGGLV